MRNHIFKSTDYSKVHQSSFAGGSQNGGQLWPIRTFKNIWTEAQENELLTQHC